MKRISKLLIATYMIAMSAGMIIGCSKDDINISVGNEQGQNTGGSGGSDSTSGNNTDSTKTKAKLFFDANVYDLFTKIASMSPIAEGRYVTVYAYNGSSLVTSVMYESETAGTLTPAGTSTDPMTLTTGTYSLYAPGVNTPAGTAVPVFSGTTLSSGLQNNTDYIWWGKTGLVVEGSSQNLEMNLQHCCIQVVIQLINSDGVTLSGTPTMSITPSATGTNVWTLTNGTISPSTSLATTYMSMNATSSTSNSITSYYGQVIMMPLQMTGNMTAKFTITVNGQSRDYQVLLPVYQNNMQAGYSYRYQVEFSNNEVTFNNTVNVISWVPVDATNTPIIPSQI